MKNLIKELEILADAVHGQEDVNRVTMRASVAAACLLEEILDEMKRASRTSVANRDENARVRDQIISQLKNPRTELYTEAMRLLRKIAGEEPEATSEETASEAETPASGDTAPSEEP